MNRVIETETLAPLLQSARKAVVLTGAGVSRESGIPTFREAQTGIWANYDPVRLATPRGFLADPGLVWRWYDMRRSMLGEVLPNPGHFAIVDMERLFERLLVVTQNIDGLHAKAGSKDVVELHGNITRFYCFDGGHDAADVPFGLEEPPRCWCGSMLRPGVVWFEEALPPQALQRAVAAVRNADVVFVVGTSGLVQPAASLPFVASDAGAVVIEVNPEATLITPIADVFLSGPSGEVLPAVVDFLRSLRAET